MLNAYIQRDHAVLSIYALDLQRDFMDSHKQKVCPVVTRERDGYTQLLLFRHPQEGVQLVKGSVEPGETTAAAALRELREESGIEDALIDFKMGEKIFPTYQQAWTFYKMKIEGARALPDEWQFFAEEDGGLLFEFFWQSIHEALDTPYPDLYDEARLFIRLELKEE